MDLNPRRPSDTHQYEFRISMQILVMTYNKVAVAVFKGI